MKVKSLLSSWEIILLGALVLVLASCLYVLVQALPMPTPITPIEAWTKLVNINLSEIFANGWIGIVGLSIGLVGVVRS